MSLGFRVVIGEDGAASFQTDAGITRPEKGKSLLAATEDFVAIDIETTGLSPMFDNMIELAAVRYRRGEIVEEFSQLVNPGYEIDEFITELTGITNEMLAGQPPLEDVLPAYLQFIGDSILVGHNVNFDVNFLYDACTDLDLPPLKNDFVDTMRIARRMYKDLPNHKLDTVLAALNLRQRDQHRAKDDAVLTAEAYLLMTKAPGFEEAIKKAPSYNALSKNIKAREGLERQDCPLYGKVCVFTGALQSLTREAAMQLVADIGGIPGDGVTKKTNYLILGNNDYCKSIKGGKSSKQKKAEKLILEGQDLQIIPESVFIDMISES